ncbi:MAG: PqqD family protein [Spirochaetota bacterium]
MFGKKKPAISRERAFAAKPKKLPTVRVLPQENGGMRVTVTLTRPAVIRFLSSEATYEKTYELDSVGRIVYDQCDGSRRVSLIVREFAKKYTIGEAEAETAVAQFLSMLMRKGLIAMSLEDSNG